MSYSNPTIDDFKSYFFRDFPYGTDPENNVLDQDIANAFLLTNVNINQRLFGSQENYNLGYFYLSAHNLVTNLQESSQGINGRYDWLQTNKSVGNVSAGYQVPPMINDNPYLAMLSKTNYGAKYLEMIYPNFIGQTFIVLGATLP